MPISPVQHTAAFDKLFRQISDEGFLSMSRVGNEVPFFISTYDPRDHYVVAEEIDALTRRLRAGGVAVCSIHLYDLCLDLLKEAELFEAVVEAELEQSKDDLAEAIANALDTQRVLLPAIEAQLAAAPEARVTFVRQVGQVYPYLRAHSLLSNLQAVAKTTPTVFFYPGKYDNRSMSLFGKLPSDHYYRAFHLEQMPG